MANKSINESGDSLVTTTEATMEQEVLKHPLKNSWTLWFFKNDKSKQWEENQKEIITFQTVEDFWGLYNHVEQPSSLHHGCDYAIFKDGIKPMWEDERNKKGGRWILNLDKRQRGSCLDSFWLEMMLCLIGETFDKDSTLVNGAVVNVRGQGDKIAMWLSDVTPEESVINIGRKLKERLGIDANVCFRAHQDAINSGSANKNSYVV